MVSRQLKESIVEVRADMGSNTILSPWYFEHFVEIGLICKKINDVFGYRFTPGTCDMNNQLGNDINFLVVTAGKYEFEYQMCLNKLYLLLKHLDDVKTFNEGYYKYFVNKLKRNCNNDEYFGVRFELCIAARLSTERIAFIKRESPDFSFFDMNCELFIECSSVRLRNPKEIKSVLYKLGSVINKKSNKSYCNSKTMLFIDMTNITEFMLKTELLYSYDSIKLEVKEAIERTQFSAVILFVYVMNYSLKRIETVYLRIDRIDGSGEVLSFLDKYYKYGEHELQNFSIPGEG